MNNRTYLIPGFKGWTFKTSDTGCLLRSGPEKPSFLVTADMPVQEISARVESILWMDFRMQGDAAKEAAKPMYAVDWAAMIQEAGTDVQHQSPSLPGWTLKISDSGAGLCSTSGAYIPLTADTSTAEIIKAVQGVLQPHLPQVEIDVQIDVFMRIDFARLITNAWAPRAAPLLDGFTADNSAFVESICADVRQLALLQKEDSTATADSICALVKQLS